MEGHSRGLNFSLLVIGQGRQQIRFKPHNTRRASHGQIEATETHLHVDLVSAKHDGDVFTDTFKIAIPVGYILVGDSGGDVEHDNTTLALDIVPVAKATKLLLPGGIPHVEADRAKICGERKRVYFHTESR